MPDKPIPAGPAPAVRPLPLARVGLVGGGQLARMLVYRGKKLGLEFVVLDPDPEAPARALAEDFLRGSLQDPAALRALTERVDLTTYDIEHINTAALAVLEGEGAAIWPRPATLAAIQDKLNQRRVYEAAGLPGPAYAPLPAGGWAQVPDSAFPLVQKTRTGGYDGRGVAILRSRADLAQALPDPEAEAGREPLTYTEALVPFEREIAVVVVRGRTGETQAYPVVDLVADPRLNLVDMAVQPSTLSEAVQTEARRIAAAAVEALEGVGVFGVELFVTPEGQVLLNEIAPRPHNSGHLTMETCLTDQFENHLRAVLGLPLGAVDLVRPGVMVNLLGQGRGPAAFTGLDRALAEPGFSLHYYGKSECRPGRKMGHYTVTASNRAEALERAQAIKLYFSVGGS